MPRIGARRTALGVVCLATGLIMAGAFAALTPPAARVDGYTPRGDVRGATQFTLTFSVPMVAFGDPGAASPATTDCGPGEGRWLDERNWVYDFRQPLASGTTCRFELDSALRSADRRRLVGERRFELVAGPPAIRRILPEPGSQVDSAQVFLLHLDGVLDPSSLEGVSCVVEGIAESLPVRLVDPARREQLLGELAAQGWTYRSLMGGDGSGQDRGFGPLGRQPAREQRVVAVECLRELPAAAQVRLAWGPGVRGLSGPASESAQFFDFTVRPDFTARVECTRVQSRSACMPLAPVRVMFSAAVPAAAALAVRLRSPAGVLQSPVQAAGGSGVPLLDQVSFAGPFEPGASYRLELPGDLKDDAGRALSNGARFPQVVAMDQLPPLARFAAEFGVLERNAQPALPVTLRDVEAAARDGRGVPGRVLTLRDDLEIMRWLKALDSAADVYRPLLADQKAGRNILVPRTESSGVTEVVGIPLPEAGLHVVELASPRLGQRLSGEPKTYFVRSSALVTNLAVHFKKGEENSLVWVTRLDSGRPLPGADVVVRECTGAVLAMARTDDQGIARIDGKALGAGRPDCNGWWKGFFVSARWGDDQSFTLASWTDGISPWDFGLGWHDGDGDGLGVHTVLDRTLLRAGDRLHMKLLVRQRRNFDFVLPAAAEVPDTLVIEHPSGQAWEMPLRFRNGTALAEWQIPVDARRGTYQLWVRQGSEGSPLEAGEFRVEDFRLPTLRAVVQLPRAPLVAPRRVALDTSVTFLAGGAAAGLPVEIRSRVEPLEPGFEGYESFSFGGEAVVEGMRRRGEEDEAGAGIGSSLPVTLDSLGGARTDLQLGPIGTRAGRLHVEMEYPDANGERLTATSSVPLWPSSVLVGISTPAWPRSGKSFAVELVTVGTDGRPVADREVVVDVFAREYFSYRRRLVGGFYAYDGGVETRRIGEGCRSRTDERGRAECELKLEGHDSVVLVARAEDEQGRVSMATDTLWLAGEDAWYGGQDSDRMDLVAERIRYEPGETARLRAEVPFRSATALVTVEREGVLDAWVQPLSAGEPLIEVPVTGRSSPNLYVSVLAVRGRLGGRGASRPTASIDLSRPTFRMGVAELQVGRRQHELVVTVTPRSTVFAPRDRAEVDIEVRRADGGPLPAGAELAFVALDEALLELQPNDSWNLLESMVRPRSLAVRTSTSMGRVIGRRHLGRKALPVGGGGGSMVMRELFDPLLTWRGRVALDARGRATVQVPLNDSLSAFRLVAVAQAGARHFGTGVASIRTHKDLMLFAGLPELLRQGDRIEATAVLRNAGTALLETALAVRANTDGRALEPPMKQALRLGPGESREVRVPLAVPEDARSLEVTFEASAGAATDAVTVRPRVLPWVGEPATWQATLERVDRPLELKVGLPKGALPGRGGIQVDLSSSLLAGLGGVRDAMRGYPFTCLEQVTSRAVALRDQAAWERMTMSLPAHLAGDGLLTYFPGLAQGSIELSAYVVSLSHAAGWALPAPVMDTVLRSLTEVAAGQRVARQRRGGAQLLLRLRAMEALARHGRFEAAWLATLPNPPERWPTTALLDLYSILTHSPAVADRDARLEVLRGLLHTRMTLAGTQLRFAGEEQASLPWLLATADLDAVRSLALLAGDPAFEADAARLARGALGRQQRGAWDSTVANAWGVLAFEAYAQSHEARAVSGSTSVSMDGEERRMDWSSGEVGEFRLPWPGRAAVLALAHRGEGAPYAVIRSMASIPVAKPLAAGYRVRKQLMPVTQANPGRWSRGDVVKVRIEFEAQADGTWVVLDDPLPAGAAILGGGLRRGLAPLPEPVGPGHATAWPTFVERRGEAYRAYFEDLPRGKWQLEYSMRLNAAGHFRMPATRLEAMYEPDRFGLLPNAMFEVGVKP